MFFFFSSRRRHTRSVSAFLLNRSSDLTVRIDTLPIVCFHASKSWRLFYCSFFFPFWIFRLFFLRVIKKKHKKMEERVRKKSENELVWRLFVEKKKHKLEKGMIFYQE